MSAISLLPGVALLATTWVLFLRLLPRQGIIHPVVASRLRQELITIAFVLGNALGVALLVEGAVGLIR